MNHEQTALVLGATGGIGGEVARQLCESGWRVRALRRSPTDAHGPEGIEWIQGDALDTEGVISAATGYSLIVHQY